MRTDNLGAKRIEQAAIGVILGNHARILHAACKRSSPLSLNAPLPARFYTQGVIDQLAQRIDQRLNELEIDQTQLAARAEISVQRLNNYIKARRMPDLPTLVRLATALETTTDWLLGIGEDHRLDVAREILRELLGAAGLSAEQIEAILAATVEAMRLLAVLPGEGTDPLRSRIAARAAWHSRLGPKPN